MESDKSKNLLFFAAVLKVANQITLLSGYAVEQLGMFILQSDHLLRWQRPSDRKRTPVYKHGVHQSANCSGKKVDSYHNKLLTIR
ncbi:hypothetical protein TNCT_529601 [Trichonephila clavata]|uniref:Uncharacterized protein n=1 Tax=Trichonephila clavata TaxID=2740835 RepID=A0A8X6GT17_TRICU|nr:hypothetical protein TNCT_529601 [Trichonephila clavata]